MSSTTEWRKLAETEGHVGIHDRMLQDLLEKHILLADSLRAACDRVDELEAKLQTEMRLSERICKVAEKAESELQAKANQATNWANDCKKLARQVEALEQKLNHESYVSDKRAQERDKAEANLKVAVGALQHYAEPNGLGEESVARAALAKLKGEQ